MSHLFLIHLLGVWLLVSYASTAASPEWWEQVVQLCGRPLVRELIKVCGQVVWRRPVRQPHRRSADIMPSYLNEDAGAFNMMLGFIPNLPQQLRATPCERQPSSLELQQHEPAVEDSKPSPEELKDIAQNRQGEAEDNIPSELEHLGLNTHSRKKRQINEALTEKCCLHECTRRSMVRFC
ncbi:prorelaxin H2-like [Sciurus carolinensis]|uniref:prorelaxin H2-like n=1 Tax=Sciurus carolinensis TaxID=30640 RepID=UPI001FB2FC69|nr:prorelaxin H2-like [Sciurus carolinensis]